MSHADITKAKIEFPGYGIYRQIMIDGVVWGEARAMPEGRHGSKFSFKNAAGVSVRHTPPPKGPVHRRTYWAAYAKNKAGIDKALRDAVIAMVTAGDLLHPDIVRKAAVQDKDKRQREIDEADAAKRKLWEDKAREAIDPFAAYLGESNTSDLIAKVIEAMQWAQAQ
jgi:hypothetical protein